MARSLKPETAAKRIMDKVAAGEAKNADDAIKQDPRLEPGRRLVMQAAGQDAGSGKPATSRPTGSGTAKLTR